MLRELGFYGISQKIGNAGFPKLEAVDSMRPLGSLKGSRHAPTTTAPSLLGAVAVLWIAAGWPHGTAGGVDWGAAWGIGTWIAATGILLACHRTVCDAYRGVRSLDRWLRVLAAAVTFLLGVSGLCWRIHGGAPSPYLPGWMFGAGILIQTASVAALAAWLPVTVCQHLLLDRVLMLCSSTGLLTASNFSSHKVRLLMAASAVILCFCYRRKHSAAPAPASSGSGTGEEKLISRMAELACVLSLIQRGIGFAARRFSARAEHRPGKARHMHTRKSVTAIPK